MTSVTSTAKSGVEDRILMTFFRISPTSSKQFLLRNEEKKTINQRLRIFQYKIIKRQDQEHLTHLLYIISKKKELTLNYLETYNFPKFSADKETHYA